MATLYAGDSRIARLDNDNSLFTWPIERLSTDILWFACKTGRKSELKYFNTKIQQTVFAFHIFLTQRFSSLKQWAKRQMKNIWKRNDVEKEEAAAGMLKSKVCLCVYESVCLFPFRPFHFVYTFRVYFGSDNLTSQIRLPI